MALALLWGVVTPVHADHLDGEAGWAVTYTNGGKLESNFNDKIRDAVDGLQPGDDITLTIKLNSQNSDNTDWYISNEAIKSLEDDSKASGGAYSYELLYTAPDGTGNTLYSSLVVGGEEAGEAGKGLHEATEGLKEFVYLGTIKNGESGTITLNVALDGDSQGNSYRGTKADLKLKFAVEVEPKPDAPSSKKVVNNIIVISDKRRRVVNTGDPGLFPYVVIFSISSVLFLISLYLLVKSRTGKENKA